LKILGIESASLTASAALVTEEGLIGEFTVNFHKTHSETMLPMIDALLKTAGVDISEVDAFAVSEGPGSFTGLRIGAALVKGLAFAAEKPVVPVPTLDAMAYGAEGAKGLVLPVLDARRNEVYGGIYDLSDGFKVLKEAEALPLTVFLNEAEALGEALGRGLYLIGDGLSVHEAAIRERCPKAMIAGPHLKFQRAGSVAALGLKLFNEGKAVSPELFSPVYLRMSQAERERLEEGLSIEPAETASIEPVNKEIHG